MGEAARTTTIEIRLIDGTLSHASGSVQPNPG